MGEEPMNTQNIIDKLEYIETALNMVLVNSRSYDGQTPETIIAELTEEVSQIIAEMKGESL
jgi:hypothetical protein